MKYADPQACPDCRAPLTGAPNACPTCGLYLRSVAASRLWESLSEADRWLVEARVTKPSGVASPPPYVPAALPAQEWAPAYPAPYPGPMLPPPPPRKPIDAGAVLLSLGALFILVAASIVSALALGVFALPLMTLVAGGLTFGADKKGLKATTETLITITSLLGALTTGIFLWENEVSVTVWGLLGVASAYGFVEATRNHRNYVMPRFLAGAFLAPTSIGLTLALAGSGESTMRIFYSCLASVILCGAGAYLFKLRSVNVGWQIAGLGAGAWAIFCGFAAWLGALDNLEPDEFFGQGYFVPLVILGAVAGGLTLLKFPPVLRITLGVIALTHLFYIVYLPLIETNGRVAVGFALVWALACSLAAQRTVTGLTLRVASAWGLILGLGPVLVLTLDQFDRVNTALSSLVTIEWHTRLIGYSEDWLTASISFLLFAAYLTAMLRWPFAANRAEHFVPLVRAAILLILPLLVVFYSPTLVFLFASLYLPAVAYAAMEKRVTPYTLVLLVGSMVPILAHTGLLALATGIVGISLTSMWFMRASYKVRVSLESLASFFIMVSPVLTLIELDKDELAIGATGVGVALMALGLAQYLRVKSVRGVEPVGTLMLVASLAYCFLALSFETSALVFLLAGVASSIIGLASQNRQYLGLTGALLGVSWVLRLVASDVETPEAYTAPFALALLALGAYYLARRPAMRSGPAMSAGLSLALLPSLPWILADPVSVRALLVGLVALAFTLVGAALNLRAVFLAGAVFLAFLALIELGPYVLLLSRWLILGAVGITCAVIGATWESRVKDGKSVVRYIHAMR